MSQVIYYNSWKPTLVSESRGSLNVFVADNTYNIYHVPISDGGKTWPNWYPTSAVSGALKESLAGSIMAFGKARSICYKQN